MKLLTIDDLCEMFQVKKSFVYSLSAQGKIPGKIRLGHKRIRWDEAQVLNWLRSLAENGGRSGEKATGR